MSLVYDDQPAPTRFGFDASKVNPNKMWLTHYNNSLYLGFMLQNGTMIERHQASKELKICDRKMAFWARDSRLRHAQSLEDAAKAKRSWK